MVQSFDWALQPNNQNILLGSFSELRGDVLVLPDSGFRGRGLSKVPIRTQLAHVTN